MYIRIFYFVSGRRESDSGHKTPSLVYYHYTTPRNDTSIVAQITSRYK